MFKHSIIQFPQFSQNPIKLKQNLTQRMLSQLRSSTATTWAPSDKSRAARRYSHFWQFSRIPVPATPSNPALLIKFYSLPNGWTQVFIIRVYFLNFLRHHPNNNY